MIRIGVDGRLDELRQQVEADQEWIKNLEAIERERTGITSLKVGYSKTFGYYLSISRTKTNQVPKEYDRKQTLTNEERYITTDLKERETRILLAREDLNRLEYEIFSDLRSQVGEEAELIRNVARSVAAADVLCGLAEVAVYQGYCRPEIAHTREITIYEGRHPVVEQSLPAGFFVPNSTEMGVRNRGTGVRGQGPGVRGQGERRRQAMENRRERTRSNKRFIPHPHPSPLT